MNYALPFIFGGFVILIASILMWLINFKDIKKARRRAKELGITIDRTTRDVPYWESEDLTEPPKFKRKNLSSYCLNYNKVPTCQWKLQQREADPDSDFPPGWRLVVEQGKINEDLNTILHKIADIWKDDYLEVTSDADRVCIHWNEWGDERMANMLHGHLADIIKTSS
ncbi:MAG TPA: hypothetical protein ENI80_07710 [Acidiferrobacteraceae bacterium]|nr:hypothetical protein [Acidiferrobacteraceae bacterium]